MATAYPGSIQTFTNPSGTSLLASGPDHAILHTTENDTVVQLENKLGLNSGSAANNQILVGVGAGSSSWGSIWTSGSLVSPNISGGTISNGTLGTPTFTLGLDATGDTFYRSAGGTVNRVAIGASNYVLTSNGTVPIWAASSSATDGWVSVSDSWTYASASTINVPSNATLTYQVGDKIKFTQSSTVKYFVITAVAATLISIAVNNDYTVANSAISAIYYSHVENPLGFPTWFAYTPILGAVAPMSYSGAINLSRYKIQGRSVTVAVDVTGTTAGTASTGITFTTPVVPVNTGGNVPTGAGYGADSAAIGVMLLYQGVGTVAIRRYDNGNWGLGAGRQIGISMIYEI